MSYSPSIIFYILFSVSDVNLVKEELVIKNFTTIWRSRGPSTRERSHTCRYFNEDGEVLHKYRNFRLTSVTNKKIWRSLNRLWFCLSSSTFLLPPNTVTLGVEFQ